jgi:hypothetical protein
LKRFPAGDEDSSAAAATPRQRRNSQLDHSARVERRQMQHFARQYISLRQQPIDAASHHP